MNFNSMSIAELKDFLSKTYQKMQDHLKKADDDSSIDTKEGSEWCESWNKMEKDYDEAAEVLKNKQRENELDEARRNKMEEIQGSLDSDIMTTRRERAQLSNDPVQNQEELLRLHDTAILGWIRNSYGIALNKKEQEAIRAVGFNVGAKYSDLQLFGTADFKSLLRARNPQNALQVGQPSKGGVLTTSTLVGTIEKAILDFSGMLQVADVFRTNTGEAIHFPVSNDTSNSGALLAELGANSTATDMTLGQFILYAHKFTSQELLVSQEMLEDSSDYFDIVSYIGEQLGERIGRALETKFTTGTGVNQPTGITLSAGTDTTAANATSIIYDDLIDLQHSVDPGYRQRPGVAWMMHDDVLKALRKLKDGNSLPIWESDMTLGAPDMILGKRVYVNQNMASSIATTAKTILYGDFNMYKVRQVRDIRLARLVERDRANDRDVFVSFLRADGGLLNPGVNAVQVLTQA